MYRSEVWIPAYSQVQQGLLIHLMLKATPQQSLVLEPQDRLAKSFEKIFLRTVSIISSLKSSWSFLEHFHFQLQSDPKEKIYGLSGDFGSSNLPDKVISNHLKPIVFKKPLNTALNTLQDTAQTRFTFLGGTVKDARSASLSFCIGLLNILRQVEGKLPVDHILGSGLLRIDGMFDQSSFEEKKQAIIDVLLGPTKIFIHPSCCKHVFDLEEVMNMSSVSNRYRSVKSD